MKRNATFFNLRIVIISFYLILFSSNYLFAKEVPSILAKTVAENFLKQYSKSKNVNCELKYIAFDSNNTPLYYSFDINKSGFVIVSAEDSGDPIIAYSNEKPFEIPDPKSPAAFWLSKRADEIKFLKQNNAKANAQISANWNKYLQATTNAKLNSVNTVTVPPLTSTTWAQYPFYNAYCPGGSVAGCCPVTMAQIMKYWSHPVQGTGSSSYNSANFGPLSANYAAHTYNWNNMPAAVTSLNADVAQLMLDCGVSIEATYSLLQTGGAVINLDNAVSAEHSYATYFGYNTSLLGVYRSSYSDPVWLSMIKNDLNLCRPVQYFGVDTVGVTGHTWVLDGYDQSDFFHMNWGWNGGNNGYFNINSLNPNVYNFTSFHEGLFGIVPTATNSLDAGIVSISPNSACSNSFYSPMIKLRNYGINPITSCTINYKLDNGVVQSIPWTGSLVTGQWNNITVTNYTLSGTDHSFKCFITNVNNSADVNLLNDTMIYNFSIFSSDNLPISEGFENSTTTLNHWKVLLSGANDWAFTNQASASGVRSLMIDNLTNTPGNVSVLQGLNSYDFSNTADPFIFFKVAYQRKATNNNDKLMLQVSNDCGISWVTKWSKQGAALATTTVLSGSNFIPSTTDFVQHITNAAYTSNTVFRWVFIADAANPGNNIYIDDINIYDTSAVSAVGIEEQKFDLINNFEIYPNPSNSETFLKFNLIKPASVEIKVTNILGEEFIVMDKIQSASGDQIISINKDSILAKGIYMVTIYINDIKLTRKLVVD